MLTIQPKDDAFCTIKRKSKYIRRRDAVDVGTNAPSAVTRSHMDSA